MKFLIVMDAIGTGGISSAFINYIHEVSKQVDCDIMVFDEESINKESLPPNVNVIKSNWRLRILGMPQNEVKKLSHAWAFIRMIFVFIAKILNGRVARKILLFFTKKVNGYDVAISYTQDVGWHSLARGCNDYVLDNVEAKVKCAYIHCDYERYGGYHKKQESMYEKFDYVFCVSDGCRTSFLKCFPNLKKKAIVMGNFTNVINIQKRALEDFISKKNCKNIVTICRISEEKGIFRTVKVVERLVNEGYDFCWTIVGGGDDYNKVVEIVEKKRLKKYIELVGMKKNPFPYLANADVFLLPSIHEAAPMVFGECWALGIPIISTETSSAKEMVENQKIGVVCDNSEEGIYNAIKLFLNGKLDKTSFLGLKENNVNVTSLKQFNSFLETIGER